jgi:hypothetical protein
MTRSSTLRELQAKTTESLDRLAGQVASGSLSPADFVVRAQDVLNLSHSRAAILGSARAKRGGNVDVAIRVAANASREQQSFLIGFARDLAEGKYKPKRDGGKGAGQRRARFALYSIRLNGTANDSWKETQLAQDAFVEALWTLGKRDNHCPDCRVQAGYGWRPLRSFAFMPGEGKTLCMVRCGCKIQLRDGQESYNL